ncbi:hypothetical protein FI667_g5248, partial [Globisporangium splendens]
MYSPLGHRSHQDSPNTSTAPPDQLVDGTPPRYDTLRGDMTLDPPLFANTASQAPPVFKPSHNETSPPSEPTLHTMIRQTLPRAPLTDSPDVMVTLPDTEVPVMLSSLTGLLLDPLNTVTRESDEFLSVTWY